MKKVEIKKEHKKKMKRLFESFQHMETGLFMAQYAAGKAGNTAWKFILKHYPDLDKETLVYNHKSNELEISD